MLLIQQQQPLGIPACLESSLWGWPAAAKKVPHKTFTSDDRCQCFQNQCYALLPKGLPSPCIWDTWLGLWTDSGCFYSQPSADFWQVTSSLCFYHFIFHNSAFVIPKRCVQRILWASYYTVVPQMKRERWQPGYSFSHKAEWNASKWLRGFLAN